MSAKQKKQKQGLFRFVDGKIAAGLGTLFVTWILGFRSADQLVTDMRLGAVTAFQRIRLLIKKSSAIFAILLSLTVITGMVAWIGDGGFYIALFSISSLLFMSYLGMIAVFSVLLATLMAEKDFTKSALQSVGELFQHILYWDVIVTMALLMYSPWEIANPKNFAIFGLSQLALFIINDEWRYRVRKYSVLVAASVGIIMFVQLTWPHVQPYVPEVAKRTYGVAERTVDHQLNEMEQSPRLPRIEAILDVNFDDVVDSTDAAIIENDLSQREKPMEIQFGTKRYPAGDFDGDGKATKADAELLRKWKAGTGAAPTPLNTRSYVSVGQKQKVKPPKQPVQPPSQKPIRQPSQQSPADTVRVAQNRPAQTHTANAVYATAESDTTGNGIIETGFFKVYDTPHLLHMSQSKRGDNPYFKLGIQEIESTNGWTRVQLVWWDPESDDERASVHRSSSCIVDSDGLKRRPKRILGDFTIGQARSIHPHGKVVVDVYFEPIHKFTEYVIVQIDDYWAHRWTAKVYVS